MGATFFIRKQALALAFALFQLTFESFDFLFVFFSFLFQPGITCGFLAFCTLLERELFLNFIEAKICGHQPTEEQDKGNRAPDKPEHSVIPNNDAQEAEERRGNTTHKNLHVLLSFKWVRSQIINRSAVFEYQASADGVVSRGNQNPEDSNLI